MSTNDSTAASSGENPYGWRDRQERERKAQPAIRLYCDHAARLIDPTLRVPASHLDALASMTDYVVTTETLISRKLLTSGQLPTVSDADAWASKHNRSAPDSTPMNKKIASRQALDLALVHGLGPLRQYALSTIVEAEKSDRPWAGVAIKHLRDAATVSKHKTRYAGRAWKLSALWLVYDFKAPLADVLAMPTASVGADAESTRIVERWEAEDWKAARNGDTAAELPRVWAAASMKPSAALEWLVKGNVPVAAVTLLVGDEGIGKSLYWVWLITHVTTGKPCPEYGIPAREPAHVFLVLTEDDWITAVRPRLEVAGANIDYVHVICVEPDGSGAPTFPAHMEVLYGAAITPALVIMDAWLDTTPAGLQVRDPQQARQALHPWKEYTASTRAAAVLLTHTNRVATANARDKYGITSELRKKARSTLFAQADPENPDCVLIGPEKSNIAGQAEATRFRITLVQHFDPTDDSDGMVAKLEYAGPVGKTARDLIGEAFYGRDDDDDEDSPELTEAMQWLEDFLIERGKTWSKTVKDEARKVGIAERTLKRAAGKLNRTRRLEFISDGFPRKTHWELLGGTPLDDNGEPLTPTKSPQPARSDMPDDADSIKVWLADYLTLHGKQSRKAVLGAAVKAGVIRNTTVGIDDLEAKADELKVQKSKAATPRVEHWELPGPDTASKSDSETGQ